MQAVDADNFLVFFGDASAGKPQFALQGSNFSGLSGFLPYVAATIVREPGTTTNITVSSDPAVTAANIAYAFLHTASDYYYTAPIGFAPDGSISATGGSPLGPWEAPVRVYMALPAVTVTARSAYEFDITFTGDYGYQQQPLLAVLNPKVTDPATGLHPAIAGATVQIVKQSSDEFRVNAPEVDNPETDWIDVYDQTNPQVAMDADGDFVITWESEVADAQNSVSDIFARRFSPSGWVDETHRDLTFTADSSAGTLEDGAFILSARVGAGNAIADSLPIIFNAADLNATALSIQDALINQLGFNAGTKVAVKASDAHQCTFTVTFAGTDVGQSITIDYKTAVIDYRDIQIVPTAGAATPLQGKFMLSVQLAALAPVFDTYPIDFDANDPAGTASRSPQCACRGRPRFGHGRSGHRFARRIRVSRVFGRGRLGASRFDQLQGRQRSVPRHSDYGGGCHVGIVQAARENRRSCAGR